MQTTIICDIDGCLFKQKSDLSFVMEEEMELLPGVRQKFNEWLWKNYKIVLMTGRKESTREITKKQLAAANLFYDELIMGCDSGGQRILINNLKDNSPEPTATAYCPAQDEGLAGCPV